MVRSCKRLQGVVLHRRRVAVKKPECQCPSGRTEQREQQTVNRAGVRRPVGSGGSTRRAWPIQGGGKAQDSSKAKWKETGLWYAHFGKFTSRRNGEDGCQYDLFLPARHSACRGRRTRSPRLQGQPATRRMNTPHDPPSPSDDQISTRRSLPILEPEPRESASTRETHPRVGHLCPTQVIHGSVSNRVGVL